MLTPQQLVALCSHRAWLMEPTYLAAMMDVARLAVRAGELPKRAAVPSDRKQSGSVAVLPLHGPIEQRGSFWMDLFGGTSTDEFGALLDSALNDSKVKGIVVDIDSPGGTVSGVMELSRKIYDARGTKPMVGVANSMAASAAYWIGSAFDKLFVTPGGSAGSVGVLSYHFDYSAAMEKDGVKATLFQIPEYKGEFFAFAPLTEEAAQHEQAELARIYSDFVSDVARNRGTTMTDVKANYGKGRVLDAKSAVAVGMADKVATLDKVISRVASGRLNTTDSASAEYFGDHDDPIEIPKVESYDWRAALETAKVASRLRMKGYL